MSNQGDEFTGVGAPEQASGPSANTQAEKKPFSNQLYPNDSLTVGLGFINDVSEYLAPGAAEPMYFFRVGMMQGSVQSEAGWVGDISNYDLIAGATLRKFAKSLKNHPDLMKGVRVTMEVRNLKSFAEIYEGAAVLRTRGVLESMKIGWIDQ